MSRKYQNLETQKLRDRSKTSASNKGITDSKSPAQKVGGSEDSELDSHTPIHEVVKQHGPADQLHISHDRKANVHTVESHHGAHVHHVKVADAAKAHAHAAQAAGASQNDHEADDHQDALQDQSQESDTSADLGRSGLPGLSSRSAASRRR